MEKKEYPEEIVKTSLPAWQLRNTYAQTRAALNEETVAEYAELYRAGVKLPLPIVFLTANGRYYPSVGFHRIAAQTRSINEGGLGRTHVDVELRQGSTDEALLTSGESNHTHGLRRSKADKKYQVVRYLEIFATQPQKWIADRAHVTQQYVSKVYQELQGRTKTPTAIVGPTSTTGCIGPTNSSGKVHKKEETVGDAHELPAVKPATITLVHPFDRPPTAAVAAMMTATGGATDCMTKEVDQTATPSNETAAPLLAAPVVNVVPVPDTSMPDLKTEPEIKIVAAPMTAAESGNAWDMTHLMTNLRTQYQECPGEHQAEFRAVLRDFLSEVSPPGHPEAPTSDPDRTNTLWETEVLETVREMARAERDMDLKVAGWAHRFKTSTNRLVDLRKVLFTPPPEPAQLIEVCEENLCDEEDEEDARAEREAIQSVEAVQKLRNLEQTVSQIPAKRHPAIHPF